MADADAGAVKLSAGDAAGAVELFTRAIQSQDLTAEARALTYHHRGIAFHKDGQPGRAILDYTQALWNDGLPAEARPRTLNNRGLAYEALGDYDSALRDYNLALKLNPAYADAYSNRGNLHRRFGRQDLAIADFDMALRNGHSRPKYVFLSMGLSLEALDKRTEAIEAYKRALGIDQNYDQAKQRLAALEEIVARERVMASRKANQGTMQAAAEPPVIVAALPGNQANAVRVDTDVADPWLMRPTPAVAQVVVPAAPPPGAGLRPTIEDREAARVQAALAAQHQAASAPQPKQVAVVTPPPPPPAPTPAPPRSETITDQFALVAPAAAATPPPTTERLRNARGEGSGQTFGLQLGSFKTEALAQAGWNAVRAKTGSLLEDMSPVVEAADIPSKGRMYRLFAEGLPTKDAASTLCASLKAHGAACFTVTR